MTILGQEVLTVTRASQETGEVGEWIDGVWSPAEVSTFTIYGSVQPVKTTEVSILPQAARVKGAEWLYTDLSVELHTVNLSWQTPPDKITREGGAEYEVHSVGDWTGHKAGVPHRVYALTRIGVDE